MKPDEKAATMAAFVRGEVQVLVATTVIEVGVDVPNASLMVIEHAERFGLAQLHQLRGRVGRGADESVCVLLFEEPMSEMAKARLKVVYENSDGFEIARQDLLIRGPGEFLGARQSGEPLLRFADLERDVKLIEQARNAADELLRREPGAAQLTWRVAGGEGIHQGMSAEIDIGEPGALSRAHELMRQGALDAAEAMVNDASPVRRAMPRRICAEPSPISPRPCRCIVPCARQFRFCRQWRSRGSSLPTLTRFSTSASQRPTPTARSWRASRRGRKHTSILA
jgi:superfamily II DNA/RNA helicase